MSNNVTITARGQAREGNYYEDRVERFRVTKDKLDFVDNFVIIQILDYGLPEEVSIPINRILTIEEEK